MEYLLAAYVTAQGLAIGLLWWKVKSQRDEWEARQEARWESLRENLLHGASNELLTQLAKDLVGAEVERIEGRIQESEGGIQRLETSVQAAHSSAYKAHGILAQILRGGPQVDPTPLPNDAGIGLTMNIGGNDGIR